MTPEQEKLIISRARAWARAKERHTRVWTATNMDVVAHAEATRMLNQKEKLLFEAIWATIQMPSTPGKRMQRILALRQQSPQG